jgi:cysteine-rich repeat protein
VCTGGTPLKNAIGKCIWILGLLAVLGFAGKVFAVRPTGGQVCGNGTIESPEECDDGNTVSGDGCSSTCQGEWFGAGGFGGWSPLDIFADGGHFERSTMGKNDGRRGRRSLSRK